MKNYDQIFPESAKLWKNRHVRAHKYLQQGIAWYNGIFKVKYHVDHSKITEGSIPIFLLNFNRLTSLKNLINWFSSLQPKTSVVIVDSASTMPELLEYYTQIEKKSNVQVIRSTKNYHDNRVLITAVQSVKNVNYYIVSDTDLEPYPSTPKDILSTLINKLNENPEVNHVGPSLEINDIPDHYPFKEDIKLWETRFWADAEDETSFKAHLDTTFSAYRGTSSIHHSKKALRLNRPYSLKHIDWYVNPENLSDEYKYMLRHCNSRSTWNTKIKMHLKHIGHEL